MGSGQWVPCVLLRVNKNLENYLPTTVLSWKNSTSTSEIHADMLLELYFYLFIFRWNPNPFEMYAYRIYYVGNMLMELLEFGTVIMYLLNNNSVEKYFSLLRRLVVTVYNLHISNKILFWNLLYYSDLRQNTFQLNTITKLLENNWLEPLVNG